MVSFQKYLGVVGTKMLLEIKLTTPVFSENCLICRMKKILHHMRNSPSYTCTSSETSMTAKFVREVSNEEVLTVSTSRENALYFPFPFRISQNQRIILIY